MVIRKATKNDLQGIYQLVKELAIFEEEADAVKSTISDYEKAFDEKLISAHVADLDGVIVGMALYYMTFSTWKGHMLYLEDFYVSTRHRSKGLGQQLFDAFVNEAKERGCKMVKWEVLDWNKEAIKFYERNGAIIEKQWWDGKIIF
ncbi:MAG: GNAT family N-acetyltransferase [Saprospiraceae bacterium]|nr:GNAT family N-acetyltransferase [Saprospiraceae bacterium]